MTASESERFDRLPESAGPGSAEPGRGGSADPPPSRAAVVSWWEDRFGVPAGVFAEYTFWERGAGKIWAFRGELPSPVAVQGLGMHVLRTRGEHWKPTTNAVQRFGVHATHNVLVLEDDAATAFVRGDDQAVAWEGDRGYLVVAREVAGEAASLGVGLYTDGRLRSQVPKARRQEL